jgi:ribose transport system substrate-binding protein
MLSAWPRFLLACLPAAVGLFSGCQRGPATVAVIPRTCGTRLWEPLHAAAAVEAHKDGLHIYWNAPTQENDVEKQIGFLNVALERRYRGVVVAPDESLVFRTPVQRLLDRHIPVVIVDDNLSLPHDPDLSYVFNDEEAGGQLAARRVAARLHGKGLVALLGIDPELQSVVARERSFEATLEREAPQIHIVVRELGDDLSVPHQQQIAEAVLHAFPPVNAIVALSGSATRGAYYAKVESGNVSGVVLVGFDQDLLPPIRSGEIDSVVIQNSPEIGRLALDNVAARLKGETVPETLSVQPVLLTRENLDSPSTHQMWHDARFPWGEQ